MRRAAGPVRAVARVYFDRGSWWAQLDGCLHVIRLELRHEQEFIARAAKRRGCAVCRDLEVAKQVRLFDEATQQGRHTR